MHGRFLKNPMDLFACHVVGYRKMEATFGATTCENFTTVLCGHSQTKSVLVDSSAS